MPLYASNGDGSFAVTNNADPSGGNIWNDARAGKLVGDFDGDGRKDVAMWRDGWNSIPVYFSQGNGTFDWHNPYQAENFTNGSWMRHLVGDFDGDGRSDILTTANGWNSTPVCFTWPARGGFHCTNFVTTTYWINDSTANLVVGDFNGDHRSDIAVWKQGWNSTPVYLSNGDGSFRISNYLTSAAEVNNPLATRIVADFNGDGRSDIVVVTPGTIDVAFYLSNGNGSFNRVVESQGAGVWLSVASDILTGDFDGDGRPDLVTRSTQATSLVHFDGTGGASFTPAAASLPSGTNWINQ